MQPHIIPRFCPQPFALMTRWGFFLFFSLFLSLSSKLIEPNWDWATFRSLWMKCKPVQSWGSSKIFWTTLFAFDPSNTAPITSKLLAWGCRAAYRNWYEVLVTIHKTSVCKYYQFLSVFTQSFWSFRNIKDVTSFMEMEVLKCKGCRWACCHQKVQHFYSSERQKTPRKTSQQWSTDESLQSWRMKV